MRTLLSVLLILVFVAATAVLTFVDAAVRVVGDPEVVSEIVARAEVRTSVVDAAREIVLRDVPADATMRAQVRFALESVLAEKWFAGSLRRLHEQLIAAAAAAPPTARLDLRATKQELARTIRELGRRVEDACVAMVGPGQCGRNQRARRDVEAQFQRALSAVAAAPNQIDLAGGREDARRLIARAPQLRLSGMIALAGVLALIVLVNLGSLRRVLGATGAALVMAAGLAMIAHAMVAAQARRDAGRAIASAPGWDPAVRAHVVPALGRVADGVIDGAVAAARLPLLVAGMVGLAFVVGALASRRDRA